VTVPVTAEVEEVAWAKHTTGKRSKKTPTIRDEVSFVMFVSLLILMRHLFVTDDSTQL
jgi:hypothetical protein